MIVEEDYRNYHALKLTTQCDSYKRMLIKDWKQIGLVRKSYVRIEIPIKIEFEQLNRKITSVSNEQLLEIYDAIYKIINFDSLRKISEKFKREK